MQPDEQTPTTPSVPPLQPSQPTQVVAASPQPVATPPAQQPPAPEVYQQPQPAASVATVQPATDPISQPSLAESELEAEAEAAPAPGEIPREGDEELVRWQAMEYIQREKDWLWYVILAVIVVAMMAIAWFFMQSITFVVLVPIMAAALIVYVRRPPAIVDYTLSRKGIHVNDRLYDFEQFKEFGLVQDDDEHSVLLVPRRRFQPGLTVYFPEEVGEDVVDMLAARLPMREIRLDFIDRLTRFLRI